METNLKTDEDFILHCLQLARQAEAHNEVPIGALIVHNGKIIAESYNLREKNFNATGHAEILSIQKACEHLQTWRLSSCDLYVTLEPCVMCAGALLQARIRSVCFGAFDPKGGALGSLYKLNEDVRLNHRFPVKSGVCADACGDILSQFFKKKRLKGLEEI